ncbi:alpha/beta hydrolase [Nocardioides sp. 1609]|uniref:alpha/beta hydrolase n=1 Tax=Nocardioides sp. 1609 TaxID=2508327 RepID=UPI00106F632C|nr:alpha/beta hydrolase [Nocardioides sp. 1609]
MTVTTWDEPAGATARGTLIVLPGRGETGASYQRFGTRLAADAYRVRLVPVDLDDLAAAREQVEKLLADESLPAPKVLVGTDSGATLAATIVGEVDADAAVLAGLALPGAAPAPGATWDDELDARSACPVHRSVIEGDAGFERAALGRPLPWSSLEVTAPAKPVLVVHGAADAVSPAAEAVAPYVGAPGARTWLVQGGRHDVLNDVSHRSVAATIVLFLESLKLGPELPAVLVPASGAVDGPA